MSHSATANRSVLITGASTGIGAACARDLDRLGFRVFAGVRKDSDGEALRRDSSERLTPIPLDVTLAESISSAAATVESAVGEAGLFGLVNNAGILVPGPLECVPLTDLRRQYEVNVFGAVAVTQAMLPWIRAARGRIVNMGSISGKAAPPYLGAYSSSKFALESITDVLRMELRRWSIDVSIVEPDSVATPIWGKLLDTASQMGSHLPAAVRNLYEQDLTSMSEASAKMDKSGMPVERVVRAVRHALTARWPKTRYPVGIRTHLAFWAARHLPDRTRDGFMRRAMGMK
ncbi:MAG: SDR family NAD(P)-dependent oxidoreductase [Planctomycetaceae bacterium]|nr:SDR family NAD(P)-dependent oxidoreductase [Planctomycetales bacterium]MCB9923105.1 SDR family NAD(P)-dependent oxidoreductase [Planctomycetaceae bacterium]